ncbi:aldo/keto reductase [Sinomonas sp. ASV322]|uniref:aldo/keto reductase n=1 Tax=Sinomonas sp. ASV322 TaxID=3041920 RepID=UPI0027DCB852|nr:aldo/keto reductase [Sinomonas sp. ASV322]MDQ4504230.1 aldo/keto reductase [Sinomonas sp. ASV322]
MQTNPGTPVPTVTLNDGTEIPQLGFGVFQVPADETQRVVEAALEAGYRHIDTAAAYRNEAGVGAAIAASGIPREDLFITTKLRNGEQAKPLEAFETSRTALGLDYIDLYLIHWPVPSQGLFVDAWHAMEELRANQLVRSIGVSNFLPEHLETLLASARVVPAVNQIELHPTFQQRELAALSRSRGIAVEAYSPLGQGADLGAEAVRAVAEAHGATSAQVVLAWHLAQGTIAIPKTTSAQRMRENLAAIAVGLSADELERISALDSGARIGSDPATAAHTQL